MGINNFFEPKTIAIIGASDHLNKVGGILLSKAIKSSAKIFPINPNHQKLFGVSCYLSVLDVKEKIDLAVIAIPVEAVSVSLNECGMKGIKNVILISAGFSEVGNFKEEEKIIKIAKKYKINFIGSNCFGICNPHTNLDLTFASSMPTRGDIAFISQSGALWSYISDLNNKLGFSCFVSLGNMENMDFNDFLNYFSKDKKTKSIVLYVEKLKDGRKFIKLCQNAIKAGKKVYAVRGGSSEVGEKAAISHTASLASDYRVYLGAFKQAGITVCESFLEMFELASGEKIKKDKKEVYLGKTGFILTNAGGAGVLLSDYLSKRGMRIIEKPRDILGTALAEDYIRHFNEIKEKKFETLFIVLTPQSMSQLEKTAQAVVSFKKELKNRKKNIVAVFLGEKSMKSSNFLFNENKVNYVNKIEEIK